MLRMKQKDNKNNNQNNHNTIILIEKLNHQHN